MRVVVFGGGGVLGRLVVDELRRGDHDVVVASRANGADAATGAGVLPAVRGADAVVFAAGAGPGSGDERKRTVDLGGAIKTIDACLAEGVRRYVMVSAMGLDRAGEDSDMGPYLQAKLEADEALMASGLDHVIVRPGRLTDDAATGKVSAGDDVGYGEVPRDDVAWTIDAVLQAELSGVVFELVGGDTPIGEAVAQLGDAPA